MGRHKQPLAKAKLKGATRKNPQRYEKEELKVGGPLGEPPKRLKGNALKFWDEIQLYALPGVITPSDRFVLEIACNLMAEYTRAPTKFPATKYTHLVGILARFGLTPSDRQKFGLAKPPGQEDDPFEKFSKGSTKPKELNG